MAIECDGERYHGPDKLEEDMARQAILERLGWKFVRIRGSIFFRDEDRAMQPVFQRLEELGIPAELGIKLEIASPLRDAVTERVIRRAEEMRIQWREEPSPGAVDQLPKKRWRRKSDLIAGSRTR